MIIDYGMEIAYLREELTALREEVKALNNIIDQYDDMVRAYDPTAMVRAVLAGMELAKK